VGEVQRGLGLLADPSKRAALETCGAENEIGVTERGCRDAQKFWVRVWEGTGEGGKDHKKKGLKAGLRRKGRGAGGQKRKGGSVITAAQRNNAWFFLYRLSGVRSETLCRTVFASSCSEVQH